MLARTYAGLGRKEEALRAARTAVEVLPISKDALDGCVVEMHRALVEARVGETDAAVEHIRHLLSIPCLLSPGLLQTVRAGRRCAMIHASESCHSSTVDRFEKRVSCLAVSPGRLPDSLHREYHRDSSNLRHPPNDHRLITACPGALATRDRVARASPLKL